MKPEYALIELTYGLPAQPASDPALSARVGSLNSLAASALACHKLAEESALPALSDCTFAVLYGSCTAEGLVQRCAELKRAELWPLVVIDALYPCDSLAGALSHLEENLVQLVTTTGITVSITSRRTFIYPFAKSDSTATICLLFDGGTQALVVERLCDPYKGKNAFPGGYMRVQLETLEQCAYRELEEECGLKLFDGELMLVDIRSAPGRDPRAHIVDAGYAALVSSRRKTELMPQLKAGDDAGNARLLPVAELLKGELAFDHNQFLLNTLKHFKLVSAAG